jgi:hypothetical protein
MLDALTAALQVATKTGDVDLIGRVLAQIERLEKLGRTA